ncbi:MAG: hypothetical protein SFV18_07905 [Bryobacteraceae bacterium]|nr:hypothetical protein [Bryobacteraceae bacterium]
MRLLIVPTIALLAAGTLAAGEKKLMHCFAFTVIETATDADWKAFAAATDALPAKNPAVSKVWHGKLRAPLNIFTIDPAARKSLMAGEAKAQAEATRVQRKHGVCMEMADEAALKTYTANPYHKEWMAAYEKVRVAGTTTFDIIGQ